MDIFDKNIFYEKYNDTVNTENIENINNIDNFIKPSSFLKNISYKIINNDYINFINLNIINNQINNKFIKSETINKNNNFKQQNIKDQYKEKIIKEQTIKEQNSLKTQNIQDNDIKKKNIKEEFFNKDKLLEKIKEEDIFIVKKIKKTNKEDIVEKTNNNIFNTLNANNTEQLESNEFENFIKNKKNKNNNKNQLELMNDLFEEHLQKGTLAKPEIKGDSIKIVMHNFINNCIMQSILRYDNNNSIYILDVIKLKNNVMNYHIKTNTNIKDNDHIIFYEQYNKWYEINYTGIVKIEITNKMLILCLRKMKDKDKFRKEIKDGTQLRGIKLKFIILNKITDLFYIKRNKFINK